MGGNQKIIDANGKSDAHMKTLYVSDLDGTLLDATSHVSDASAAMLNEAIAAGKLFTIATARTPSTVEKLMEKVDARLPFIVMTGAALWNPADGRFSNSITIPTEQAEKILSIIRAHNLPAFIYMLKDDKVHIYHIGPLSETERKFISERSNSRFKVFHIPDDGDSRIPEPLEGVSLFYAMQPSALVEQTYRDIKDNVECNPIFYHDMFGPETGIMEVFAKEASKANAIKTLREISGASEVVAFGDNLNDLPMMKEADVAVAVSNAVGEVKAAADIIIGKNTDDAVARAILLA